MCNCCLGSLSSESCGWPKGTVRATISLITIPLGFILTAIIIIILIFKEQYTIALGVHGVIWGVIGTIVGHYFGSKQAEGAAKLISEAEHDIINMRNNEILSSVRNGNGNRNSNNNDRNNNDNNNDRNIGDVEILM